MDHCSDITSLKAIRFQIVDENYDVQFLIRKIHLQ